MYRNDYSIAKRVDKIIVEIMEQYDLKNKDIYIFGLSSITRRIIHHLLERQVTIKNIIDNNKNKYHSCYRGLEIVPVENVAPVGKNTCIF